MITHFSGRIPTRYRDYTYCARDANRVKSVTNVRGWVTCKHCLKELEAEHGREGKGTWASISNRSEATKTPARDKLAGA